MLTVNEVSENWLMDKEFAASAISFVLKASARNTRVIHRVTVLMLLTAYMEPSFSHSDNDTDKTDINDTGHKSSCSSGDKVSFSCGLVFRWHYLCFYGESRLSLLLSLSSLKSSPPSHFGSIYRNYHWNYCVGLFVRVSTQSSKWRSCIYDVYVFRFVPASM